jgi:hypothetical protein
MALNCRQETKQATENLRKWHRIAVSGLLTTPRHISLTVIFLPGMRVVFN